MVATEVVLITDVDVPEDASGDVDDGTVEEATTEVDVPEVDAVGVVVDPTVGAVAEGELPDDASDVVDGRSTAKEDSDDTTASEDECSSSSDNASASSLA